MLSQEGAELRFEDGTRVTQPLVAKHLGCELWEKELGRQLGDAARTWQNKGVFRKSAACSPNRNLLMYDAAAGAKVAYGLCTAAVMQGRMAREDAFQMRGLRQILKMRYPCVERAKTNQKVMGGASACRLPKSGRLNTFPEYCIHQRLRVFRHVVRALHEGPMRIFRFVPHCGIPLLRAPKRVDLPSMKWTIDGRRCSAERVATPLAAATSGRLCCKRPSICGLSER